MVKSYNHKCYVGVYDEIYFKQNVCKFKSRIMNAQVKEVIGNPNVQRGRGRG